MKIVILLVSLLRLVNAINEQLIHTSLNLSQATYCDNYWNCKTCDSENKLSYVIKSKGTKVLVGYNDKYKKYFVSYRGSSNLENWISNVQFTKIYPYNGLPSVGVDKGFYYEFKNNYKTILKHLEKMDERYNCNEIIITGHSSGAAMATLLAYELETNYKVKYNVYSLITFGSPRVGNMDFTYVFRNYNFLSYRITHYYDIVPHLPQEKLDYNHIPSEIWYNQNNTEYKLCNDMYYEDESCSNSCYPYSCISTSDHMNYLNIRLGQNGDC